MITCPNCGQQTETGKFCTHCGADLGAIKDTAAAADPTIQGVAPTPTEQPDSNQQTQQPNEVVEKLKDVGGNFGHFFVTLLKKPGSAKQATKKDFISGIITLAIFSIVIALSVYLSSNGMASYFIENPFVDLFLKPLLYFLVLVIVMLAVTYGGMKLTGQTTNFQEVLGKFGAYTVPFLILLVIGLLFSFVSGIVGGSLLMLSILGIVYFIPTFTLFEKPANGMDRIYVLLGVYIVSTLVSGFILQSIAASMLSNMMGGFFGGL